MNIQWLKHTTLSSRHRLCSECSAFPLGRCLSYCSSLYRWIQYVEALPSNGISYSLTTYSKHLQLLWFLLLHNDTVGIILSSTCAVPGSRSERVPARPSIRSYCGSWSRCWNQWRHCAFRRYRAALRALLLMLSLLCCVFLVLFITSLPCFMRTVLFIS